MNPSAPGAGVLFLCRRAELSRERLGLQKAFERRGSTLWCIDDAPGAAADLGAVARAGLQPALIIHPDGPTPILPAGIETSPVPTCCFQIDSFMAWQRRARWSLLFDRVFVFHDADVERYRAAGNPDVMPLFHAADVDAATPPAAPRDLEVSLIGRTDEIYARRRRCLEALDGKVGMNEWRRPHRPDEAKAIYGRSKIVLNVGRDDFPGDVGVRFGEAMIAGALFATILPTELTTLGFVEGRDFVGFQGPDDVVEVCRRQLADDAARQRIAASGQKKVLSDHTYDRRAATILDGAIAMNAPARRWSPAVAAATRLDYFAAKGELRGAARALVGIGLGHPALGARSVGLLARAAGRRVLGRLRRDI
jgi:hypothetical protein